ncbi:MAG: GNAT family N-acetyltransferase [Halomonadaceae bacterium]|nr:GNAT family N-acetyltransferase [Halomonas sp.]
MPTPDAAVDAAFDTVIQCPLTLRRQAILQLAGAQYPAGRQELAQAVDAHLATPEHDWDGLWVAMHGDTLQAALWVQPLPGNMAQLWQPHATGEIAAELLAAARRFMHEQGFALCQTVLAPDDTAAARQLEDAGMRLLAPLEYLTAPVSEPPTAPAIRLSPWAALGHEQQLALLGAVQEDSLDCVALREALDTDALLAGFLQQDDSAPANWWAVYLVDAPDSAPVGALLLAPRREVQGMELLLMGITTPARGRGLGRAVLDAAFAEACKADARRLLLSVDTTNTPACRLYRRAGFSCYSRQQVYAWIARPTT